MQAEDAGRSNQTAQARVQASQRLKPHAPAAICPANLNPLREATVLVTRVEENLDGREGNTSHLNETYGCTTTCEVLRYFVPRRTIMGAF